MLSWFRCPSAALRTLLAMVLLVSAPVYANSVISLEVVPGDSSQVVVVSHFELDELPQHSVTTASPYFEGQIRFSGPLLEDVLVQLIDKEFESQDPVTLRALNDYFVETTFGVLSDAKAIIATRKEGTRLSIRDRGPFWIMLPLSDRPELDSEQYHRLLVWQLSRIELGN